MARPQPVQPISVASTCEFGLESARLLLCKYVWFHSPVHSNAFCLGYCSSIVLWNTK